VSNRLKYLFLFVLLVLILAFGIFPQFLFKVSELKVQGNTYLSYESFLDLFNKEGKSFTIFSFPKKKLKEKILKNPFIQNIQIIVKAPHTLVLKVKEKNIVGVFIKDSKKYLISEKNEILPMISPSFFKNYPQIEVKNSEKEFKLKQLTEKLAILKYNDLDFFKKIRKIHLDTDNETTIFIGNSGREYIFFNNLLLEDFIKIKILNLKIKNAKRIVVKGDSVTIH
jgi:cell division septal protein FtsQ